MKRINRRARGRRALISAAMAAILLCLAAVGVSAETTPYLVDGLPRSGALVGNKAGSYASFLIAYPGGNAELRLDLVMALPDPTFANMAGVRLYAPYGYTSVGAPQEAAGSYALSYRSADAATLYVQVSNYSRATLGYEIVASGLGISGLKPPQTPEPTATAPSVTPAENGAISGTLVGNGGGAFDEHALTYTGAEGYVTVSMACQPADPSVTSAFGFEVWSPSGKRVAVSSAHKSDPHGTVSATFRPDVAGQYLLKVSNYAAGVQLTYTVTP